jgi:hypothetical protein
MALHIRGNVTTLADFGLLKAARPVLYREREIARKRNARSQEREQKRMSIVCANGFVIRPIK